MCAMSTLWKITSLFSTKMALYTEKCSEWIGLSKTHYIKIRKGECYYDNSKNEQGTDGTVFRRAFQ
jgi:hypothetical protein